MYDPFFNPRREFLKALWKVVAIFAMTAIAVLLLSSCRTSASSSHGELHSTDSTVVVFHYDTITYTVRDTVRTSVSAENTSHEEHHIVYDTETGRKREEWTVSDGTSSVSAIQDYISSLESSLSRLDYRLMEKATADSVSQTDKRTGDAALSARSLLLSRSTKVVWGLALLALIVLMILAMTKKVSK